MIWIILLTAAAAFAITALSLPLIIRFATRVGFVDRPGPRKSHAAPMPYGGGIGVGLGFLLTLGAGIASCWLMTRGTTLGMPAYVVAYAPGAVSKAPDLFLLAGGSLVILFLGTADDRWKLSPSLKLIVEALVATGFVIGSERLSLFLEG